MSEFALAEVQEAVSAHVPDRPAIRWCGETRTHADFNLRTRQLARVLTALGLAPSSAAPSARWDTRQTRVAILMLNRPEWLEAMFGCFKARALPFNVNYRYVGPELAQLMSLAKVDAIIYESRYAEQVEALRPELPPGVPLLQVADDSGRPVIDGAIDYETALRTSDATRQLDPVSPDDGYLLYTGGTTGLPKGVLWRQADAYVAAFAGGSFATGDEYSGIDEIVAGVPVRSKPTLIAMPLMHGGGQWTAVSALLSGNTVVLPAVVDHLDAADIWRTAETERVSLLAIAGNAFAAPLLEELDRYSGYDLLSLRIIVSGAVAFGAELKSRMLAHLPWVTIIDNGGSSETGAQMELRTSSKSHAESGVFEARPGTLVVRDDLSGMIAAGSHEVGWLARQGRVPLGYLFDEHATATTFPIVQGIRFSITGDRATVLADGRIAFQGRDATTINTGGEKVHAEEVEAAIASHGTVADVVVVGSPSERWGSEVTAIIQWRPGCVATLDDLRSHAGIGLASYKLPRRLLAVDRIRRLDSGKVDYRWAMEVTRTHHDGSVEARGR